MKKIKIENVTGFRVESLADGTLRVYPDWEGYEEIDGEPGYGGVLERVGLARTVEKILNEFLEDLEEVDRA